MDGFDGINVFTEICEKNGIKCSDVFVMGRGERIKKRCNFSLPNTYEQGKQKFAVKYYRENNIFIVWCLRKESLQGKCTVSTKGFVNVDDNKIHIILKSIATRNGGKEAVYVFTPFAIQKFIDDYVLIEIIRN